MIEIPLPHLPTTLLSSGSVDMAIVGDVMPPSSSGWEAASHHRFTVDEFVVRPVDARFDVVLVAIESGSRVVDRFLMQELVHRALRPGGTIAQAAPLAVHTPHLLPLTRLSIPVDGRDLIFSTYRSPA